VIQDFRFALRMLWRSPGLTATILATLAIAIGMKTAIFSVAHTALFRPLACPDPERLVWITNHDDRQGRDIFTGRGAYLAWKQQTRSFDAMTGYGNDDLALVAGGEASEERIASITGDFWRLTGARQAHGRLFAETEPDALVISWNLFERRFGGDVRVIGRPVTLNGHPFTVVGVLAKDFRFVFPQQYEEGEIEGYIPIPTGLLSLPHPLSYTIWEPAVRRLGPAPYALHVVARLRRDVPMDQGRAEMQTIYANEARRHPGIDQDFRSLTFMPLREKISGGARRALLLLVAAAGFVLLIACANIANLLMSRAAGRRREMAIRTALGAGKARLLRQSLAEGLLLSTGGALGVGLAHVTLEGMKAVAPSAVPRLAEATIDGPVLWFTVVASLVTGITFGLVPAFVVWGAEVHEALKANSSGAGRDRGRSLELLATLQFALAIVLLAGAGLLLKSLWRMQESPPGFTPERILVMRVTLSGPQYGAWPAKQAYTEELLRRVRATPGVEAAGVHTGSMNTTVRVGGRELFAAVRGVSTGYLQAMGSPLVKGSWPAEGSLFGVVVNEAFARHAGIDVAGQHIGGFILNEAITGVVADFKANQLDAEPTPEVYVPYERLPVNRSMRVAARVEGSVTGLAPAIREIVRQVDPTQPVYEFSTLEQALASSIAPRRFNLFLLGSFAATAMLLASIGIYGVIAYAVTRRTREIGVRMALGAHREEIAWMVAQQGLRIALAGIVPGLAAAAALTRLMASLLYGVAPNDLWTFAVTAGILAVTALIACCGPALRAASVDPMVALRHE
jgi:putative ABC transport system permease protein